ncbi:MAG: hypothetical protein A2X28_04590 [Elusimicrobia bacterium GWA2_56_46]|nr:MAG: hypothetical protein A2X28_04590 [Elusimicrobia bacterium GWA2_56_46]OGR56153.1 MAG: hypothetical protein A2X39_08010 [Elusimicrobia bacterium GWC2_56_31]HBW23074.1 hypothetical protein [Elusimicrobiota bacterium]
MKTRLKQNGRSPLKAARASGARAGQASRRKKLERAVDSIEGAYLASARFSVKELSFKVLRAAKDFTGSAYGFAAYIDRQTGWMIAPTLSGGVWKRRTPADKPLVFREFTGLWGWVLKNKKPLLTNTAASDPRSAGTPAGHMKISKFLAAPAVFNRNLAGILAVANSGRDYDPEDLAAIKRLARVYAIILQRKLAEERLRESEEKHKAIINASQDITYTINLDGRLTYISRQVCAYGYSPRGIIGRHVLEFAHPDDRYLLAQALSRAVKTGSTPPILHYRLKKKDGSYFHAEQKSGVMTKDGKPFMFSGVIRDVTERDQLRNKVVEDRETLRMIFDTATDAIFIKDQEGRYLKTNKACAAMFGLSPQQLAGKTDFDVFPKKTAETAREEDRETMSTGKSMFTNKEIELAGQRRVLYEAKTPLKDANGAVTGVLGIARDITELKKLEAELVRTKAVEAVNRVARPAAHDFNNILAAINGYAVLIMETLKTGNPVKPEIAQIMNAVKRAAAITERLQTYAAGAEKEKI